MIALDLRGYGDSDLSSEDVYDLAAWSRDIYLLVHDVLGHEQCGVVGGDLGGAIACDLVQRYPGFVEKLVFFDSVPPFLFDDFAAAGIDITSIRAIGDGPTSDYRYLQGVTPDELAAELDTPAKRQALRRRDVRPPAVGVAGHVHRGRRRLHDRALLDRGADARGLGGVSTHARTGDERAADPRPQGRRADVDPLRHGRPRGRPRLSCPPARWRSPTAPARWCCPARDTSCSGNGDMFNPLVIAYFGDLRVRHGR